MTAVRVTRSPFGDTSFSQAVADVFEADTLTVSCADPDFDRQNGPLEVFTPGTWLDATVFDERGNPLSHFQSALGRQQEAAQRASVRRTA